VFSALTTRFSLNHVCYSFITHKILKEVFTPEVKYISYQDSVCNKYINSSILPWVKCLFLIFVSVRFGLATFVGSTSKCGPPWRPYAFAVSRLWR
jgi:hypothetical protein